MVRKDVPVNQGDLSVDRAVFMDQVPKSRRPQESERP